MTAPLSQVTPPISVELQLKFKIAAMLKLLVAKFELCKSNIEVNNSNHILIKSNVALNDYKINPISCNGAVIKAENWSPELQYWSLKP